VDPLAPSRVTQSVQALVERWEGGPLARWAAELPQQLEAGLSVTRFGDLPRWQSQLDSLPGAPTTTATLDSSTVTVNAEYRVDAAFRSTLETALRGLHPWRKGPFELFGVLIDTEWHSDWKWDRLISHLGPLDGQRVLDVGCGNGYHCWRMRGAGATEVVGIDPTPLFVLQFRALQHYIRDDRVNVLPLGIEGVPRKLRAFDSVFSMGILYHRRSPMEHLQTLKECLRPGGRLVLETLVISGDSQSCLVPRGRYAKMGNVWFIPSSSMLQLWLEKMGFRNVRLVDETVTTTEEQRRTDWMQFHSLADFLDPQDSSKTIEGYPAPRRAILIAEAP
jgi:tRNA (mo5U34)-methyltransferase